MSEPQTGSDTLGSQALPQETTEFGQDVLDSIQAISRPVEMANLSTLKPVDPTNSSHAPVREGEEFDNETDRTGTAETSRSEGNVQPTTANAPPNSQVDSAIGPSTDKPTRIRSGSGSGPQLIIVLLLHSTHTRHPYTINDKYLKKRNVSVADNDPINMSVYTLKELIWRDWREEWEARPASPTSIRLIHMGGMLDDKASLKDSRFSSGATPHVVHMTMKPQEVVDDEDARIAKGSGRDRDGNERTPGCRCLIM